MGPRSAVFIRIALIAVSIIALTAIGAYVLAFHQNPIGSPEYWAHFGEYIGGVIGPLLSAAAIFLVIAQLDEARLTSKLSLRAYVNIKLHGVTSSENNTILAIPIEVINAGKTTARITSSVARIARVNGNPFELTLQDVGLIPGAFFFHTMQLRNTNRNGAVLFFENVRLTLHVTVVYTDAYNEQHESRLSASLDGDVTTNSLFQILEYTGT